MTIIENKSINNLYSLYKTISNCDVVEMLPTKDYTSIKCEDSAWPNLTYCLERNFLNNKDVLAQLSNDIINRQIEPLIISNNEKLDMSVLKQNNIYIIDRWIVMDLDIEDFKYLPNYSQNKEIEIGRIITTGEVEEWVEVLSKNLFNDKKLSIDVFTFLLENSSDLFYVKQNNKIVGTSLVHYDENDISGVYMVCIDKDNRKSGLGKELMNYTFTEIRKKGIKKVTLQSTKVGVNLYSSLGFEERETINLLYKILK